VLCDGASPLCISSSCVNEFTCWRAQVFLNRDSALHVKRPRRAPDSNNLMAMQEFSVAGTKLV
jgi:hypothetical protein